MGLFDELDIAGAADDPWKKPNDTYECVVKGVKAAKAKSGKTYGVTYTYKITAGDYEGDELTEWKRIPHKEDAEPMGPAEKARALSYNKQRLASLGVPEERMNTVTEQDLIGIKCYVTTEVKNDFTTVVNVSTEGVSTLAPAGNPFADSEVPF